MPNPTIHVFPNGLRLVYEKPKLKLPQTHLRAFCHVGSIHEPSDIRGAAHFIEHMCFKGSKHFPSWAAVNEPLSQSGAFFNATTTKQYTVYKINCLDSYVHEFLRILADMMLLPKFDKAEYKLELNVVKEEMKMSKPESYVEKLVFSGTPYEDWVDHKSFHNPGCLPYEKVVDFYHKYYIPPNITLSIVSPIPLATILKYLAGTSFVTRAPCPRIIHPTLNFVPNTVIDSASCESKYIFQSSSDSVTRVEIGFRICNQFQPDEFYVLNVLRDILGGSMSSRLFVELRERRGLTYNSGANMLLYEPAGVFIVHAITDVTRLIKDGSKPGVLPVLFGIIDDLIQRGVKEAEVKHSKTRIREQLKMESVERAGYNGIRVMLHNETKILTNPELYEECYKSITKTDVNAMIDKYFAPRQLYFSVVGGKLPKKSELMQFLASGH